MVRIKRGGRELTVADADLTGYLEQGYSVIDEKGNELTRAKAVTYEQAVAENAELRRKAQQLTAAMEAANTRIAEQDAEIARLKDVLVAKETDGDATIEPHRARGKVKAADKQHESDVKSAEKAGDSDGKAADKAE